MRDFVPIGREMTLVSSAVEDWSNFGLMAIMSRCVDSYSQ
ncbi:hypothetical protein ACZ87_00534 [Candidatus Erwinia dacicola]|uniref:Uncharacterized protein n=1 Tax=Candidatus Erwinia dacicola TaxID=252393 RepID=A0A328TQA5_9GAMM|nr:hypothetical protein ACZ87_00534 [Candidatus Erwinia dacicola]